MECDTKEVAVDESPKPKLYSYWRSSCSQRVRIALNLKGLDYEYKAVNLLKGEQFDPEFEKLNPVKLVPVLVDGDVVIGDSFAILLYLEEKYPEHPLLPKDLEKKALNLQYLEEKYPQHPLLPKDLKKKALNLKVASIVCSSIQPLHYFSSPNFMESKIDDVEKLKWTQNQICKMFTALEKLLKGVAGKCATGDEVLLADVFLAPQIHSGVTRFKINMSPFPTLSRVHETYNELPEFQAALPERQPDCS